MVWGDAKREKCPFFVGVPETITGEHLNTFLTKDLLQALDLTIPSNPLLVERVHRIGPPRDHGGGRPRQVIAKFQNWTIKQILRAYRRKDKVKVRDSQILVF